MKAVLKYLVASTFACSIALTGCGGGGGSDSADGSNNTGDATPTPPAPQPSVTVLDARADGDDVVLDLLVADAQGNIVEGLTTAEFVSLIGTTEVDATPSDVDSSYLPGSYSAVALLDQSDSIEENDEFDLRLSAMKRLYSVLGNASEVYTIAFAGDANQARDPIYDLPEQFYDVSTGFVQAVDESAIDALAQWENGGSPLFDAIIHGVNAAGGGQNDAKVVLILSDGENDNANTIDSAIAAANAAGIRVVAIGLNASEEGANNLMTLATETDGAYVLLEGAEQLDSVVSALNTWLTTLDETVTQTDRSHYTIRILGASVLSEGIVDVDVNGSTVRIAYDLT